MLQANAATDRNNYRKEMTKFFVRFLILFALYITVIVAFGLIYSTFFRGDFYAPYAHFEPYWKNEENKFGLNNIIKALMRSSKASPETRSRLTSSESAALLMTAPEQHPSIHPLIIDILDVRNFAVEEQGGSLLLSFGIMFTVEADQEANSHSYYDNMTARFWPAGSFVANRAADTYSSDGKHVTSRPTIPGILTLQREGYPWKIDDPIFKSLVPETFGQSDRVIELTDSEAQEVDGLLTEYTGLSGRVGENKLRMIYFSTVVITTLGLGDIIPLSPCLRACVALEATFGILFLGVIVSQLSKMPSRSPQNRERQEQESQVRPT